MGKDKRITSEHVKSGDTLIGFKSPGFRSNGMTLVRFILKEKFGAKWVEAKYNENKTWGEVVLTPSVVYHNAIMALHGRYGEKPQVQLKGVAHITGGGIPGNICRILDRTGSKADLSLLPPPTEEMQKVIELGNVAKEEAEMTWNLGIGMIIVVDPKEQENNLEKI
jgi:phosphoribosylformylglycinamidine cyclo-ligase